MPVSDRLNYALRPNKNVERKLMVEVMAALAAVYDFASYRYIGLGSLWFVDFGLVHRGLGITDMISIERDTPERAKYNRPYRCIEIVPGDTETRLPSINLEMAPSIVWLDHESGIEGSAFGDVREVCKRVPAGSIVVITIKAQASHLKNQRDPDGNALTKEAYLRMQCGDAVPYPILPDALDKDQYPVLLANIMRSHIQRVLLDTGRAERFWQLFNYSYADGSPMITVGGLITTQDKAERVPWQRLQSLPGFCGAEQAQIAIAVPILTPREKAALDRMLPSTGGLTEDGVRNRYNFSMDQNKLSSYTRYYPYYPLFGEYLS